MHTQKLIIPPNNSKTLFSSKKPKIISRNPRKPSLNLSLITNAAESSRPSDSASSSSSTSTSTPSNETIFAGDERVPLEGVIQFDKPSFSVQLNKWGRVALLSGGDVLALLVFSAIGRFSHGFPVFDMETLHTADPFSAGQDLNSSWSIDKYWERKMGTNNDHCPLTNIKLGRCTRNRPKTVAMLVTSRFDQDNNTRSLRALATATLVSTSIYINNTNIYQRW
ncbi:hypothetical protein ACHQM5_021296 [Ranunculus cassubicifolius]